MTLAFSGTIFFWRGPAPHYFVTMPAAESADLKAIAKRLTYGWGVIPVEVQLGSSTWRTSLFPKDGGYLVPIRATIRQAEQVGEGDEVHLTLHFTLVT